MSESIHFPNDENGTILQRMYDKGDDLTQPRNIDFNFAFPERRQALAFAELVDERNLEACISYYEEREMWQVIVKKYMIPTYAEIGALESTLTARSKSVGGEDDGWGCMLVKKRQANQ